MMMDQPKNTCGNTEQGAIAGNVYDKYHAKNPIARLFMHNFLKTLDRHLGKIEPNKCLEVGCGEGYLLSHIHRSRPAIYLEGTDFSKEIVDFARRRHPDIFFKQADVLDLPYDQNAFDLVIACEVLEHIGDYERALREIQRVGSRHFIISVPCEPVWRFLNMARFKYLDRFGNTPGHVNHWSKRAFLNLIARYFTIEREISPFPWTMVSCSQKS